MAHLKKLHNLSTTFPNNNTKITSLSKSDNNVA